ncbi:hypothetical protein T484DRAFT_1947637 [Baffinella frigidus]|nr:hypothetical protein T484DRAFT_1947637 [Cryptophyta sp. CCMP2293]
MCVRRVQCTMVVSALVACMCGEVVALAHQPPGSAGILSLGMCSGQHRGSGKGAGRASRLGQVLASRAAAANLGDGGGTRRSEAGNCLRLRGGWVAFSDGNFLGTLIVLPAAALMYGAIALLVWLLTRIMDWLDFLSATSGGGNSVGVGALSAASAGAGGGAAPPRAAPVRARVGRPQGVLVQRPVDKNLAIQALATGAVSSLVCAVAAGSFSRQGEDARGERPKRAPRTPPAPPRTPSPPPRKTPPVSSPRTGAGMYGPAVGEMYGYRQRSRDA